MFQNIKKINFLSNILIVALFLITFLYQLLFFSRLNLNSDFSYYKMYLNTFYNLEYATLLEQGLSYHYLVSIFLGIFGKFINSQNFDYYMSNSIHFVNNLLFLISIFGVKKLLNFYDKKTFENNLIIVSLFFLPFLNQARYHYKPEIYVIALLPWLIYFIELYLRKKHFKYLFGGILIFSNLITLKGNIFAMLGLMCFLIFIKNYKNIPKIHILLGVILFFSSVVLLTIENNRFNNLNLFENTQSRTETSNYDNKLTKEFFTEFDLNAFVRKPSLDSENINFFSIVLVDTFNDYFGVSWNVDHFPMQKNYDLFNNWILNKLFNFSEYYFAFVISCIFYVSLIFIFFKFSLTWNEKVFVTMPFLGFLILIINSLGIPFNNFDPQKGDTFKTIYISFLLLPAYLVLIKKIFLKTNNLWKFLIIFGLIIFSVFSQGINIEKFSNQKFIENRSLIIQHSPLCNILEIKGEKFSNNLECFKSSDACSVPQINKNYTSRRVNEDGTITFFSDDGFKQIDLLNYSTKESIVVYGFDECYFYKELGFSKPFFISNLRKPIINTVFLFILLVLIASINFEKKLYLNKKFFKV